jgi:hypothetical protein
MTNINFFYTEITKPALLNLGDASPQGDAEKNLGDAASWKF